MRALLVVIVAVAVAACTKPAGGPLKYTFDNTRIASVPLDAKQSVTQAQQQHDMAVLQKSRAEQGHRDSEIEEEVAEFQAGRSMLVSQVVALRVMEKPASPSAESAALARRAAEAKVQFARARHDWLGKLASSTFYAVYATQARLELERAKVAQANNLAPAGFDLAIFQTQADQREMASRNAAAETERAHGFAASKLTAWGELERAFMQASKLVGPLESDRVAEEFAQQNQAPAAPPPGMTAPAASAVPSNS